MQIHLFDLQNLSITQYPFTLVAFTPFLKDFQLIFSQKATEKHIFFSSDYQDNKIGKKFSHFVAHL
jgi:hypothetical protein